MEKRSAPLTDAPSTLLNRSVLDNATSKKTTKRTCKQTNKPSKKAKITVVAPALNTVEHPHSEPSASCGIGPSAALPSSPSLQEGETASDPEIAKKVEEMQQALIEEASKLKSRSHESAGESASDVWAFMSPMQSQDKPTNWDPKSLGGVIIFRRPDSPYVACKLCAMAKGAWKVYSLKKGSGMTTCIRAHLKNKHDDVYTKTVEGFQLKHHNDINLCDPTPDSVAPFSRDRAMDLLADWIVADDQASNVLECPEFRKFALYLGAGNINDDDLPHRTQMANLIIEKYNDEVKRIAEELGQALGRISFSMDLWSDPNLRSFMAVTAHYII